MLQTKHFISRASPSPCWIAFIQYQAHCLVLYQAMGDFFFFFFFVEWVDI